MPLTAGKLSIGRDESYWQPLLSDLPWLDESFAPSDLLLLAPHPDDEVLGCGGLLQRWQRRAQQIEIWMVTNGEACFGAASDTRQITNRRQAETYEAHRRLEMHADVKTVWLSLPDSGVNNHLQPLRSRLGKRLTPDTVIVAPLAGDGHPDHDGTGAVARELAAQHQLLLLAYPIWLWHWGDSGHLQATNGNVARLQLTAAEAIKKRSAIAAFSSQIYAEHGEAILPRLVLRHFRRSFEVFFVEDYRAQAHR